MVICLRDTPLVCPHCKKDYLSIPLRHLPFIFLIIYFYIYKTNIIV